MVKFVFVGAPLLDISAKCKKEILENYDLRGDDCIKATDKHDTLFQQLFNDSNTELSSGGSAQNSARVAKWIAGHHSQVSFLGCTGNDTYETWLKEKLLSDGVIPLYVQHPELKTGICACIIVEESDRSMITRHEASATISAQHLKLQPIQKHINQADYIYVEGYVIGHSPDVVLSLANNCSATQTFSLSLSAEYICKEHTDILLRVIPRVDILFGNEAEVKVFATALGAPNEITVEEALLSIRKLKYHSKESSRIIIVTCGSKPVILDDGSSTLRIFQVPSNISMVDSVGCGDALAGAFLAAYSLTKDLDISIQTGIRAATEIAQVKAFNLPVIKIFDPENVEKYIQQNQTFNVNGTSA